jgi:hypothetical protein
MGKKRWNGCETSAIPKGTPVAYGQILEWKGLSGHLLGAKGLSLTILAAEGLLEQLKVQRR